MFKIAFSGFDGIGKSQQIQLLKLGTDNIFQHLQKLVDYGNEWPALSEQESHRWWFEQVDFDLLAQIIINSLNMRNKSCVKEKINILDRGTRMFKAVLAATYATRDLGQIEDAYKYIDNLFDKLLDYSYDEYEFLLLPDDIYQSKIKFLVETINNRRNIFDDEQTTRYNKYQNFLACAIRHYYNDLSCEQKIVVDSCIIDIQNEIRLRLNAKFGLNIPTLCTNVEKIIALGGLSESGKSSFGDTLSKNYGFYRLKLRYFENILLRNNQKVNESSMANELIMFSFCHPYITRITVESIHDSVLPAYLKMLLGDRLIIALLKMPEKIRIHRLIRATDKSEDEAITEIRKKDEIKKSRGLCKVENFSDILFDNSQNGLKSAVKKFTKSIGIV